MCGIFAISPSSQDLAHSAVELMIHRGPDSQAVVDLGFACVGVTRLAITDLKQGQQPLRSYCGRYVVAFNGAIYNYRELLAEHAEVVLTGNDGEIIHVLYKKYGLRFTDHLDGMYAILLADLTCNRLVVAVDPIGIKPLYKVEASGIRIFSSTIRAIPQAYHDRVKRVPNGTVATDCSLHHETRPITKEFHHLELIDLLTKAVERRIPLEVPWACMLSGGVDSSLITALARRVTGKRVAAYTVGFGSREYTSDDLLAARQLAKNLDIEHVEIHIEESRLLQIVRSIVEHSATFNKYVVMSGLGTYLVAERASQDGMRVLLSGEGADELFAGYDDYLDLNQEQLESKLFEDQNDLGATECLRLDRCSMAHSIEARVPFLANYVVDHAHKLAPDQKIAVGADGRRIRKYALRCAAAEVIPEALAWRPKNPFFRGAGAGRCLTSLSERLITDREFSAISRDNPQYPIESKMVALFFKIWQEHYPNLAMNLRDLRTRGLARQADEIPNQPL